MIYSVIKSLFGQKEPEETALDELDDRELMQRYADGEEPAFTILFERHRRRIYNFILRRCGRRDVADKLLQDVFLRIIKSADSYKPSAKFTTWAYTIARNACIDDARSRSRAELYSLQNSTDGDDGDQTHQDRLVDDNARSAGVNSDRHHFRDRLQDALETLPEKQREVFVLKEISGLTFREVADVVDAKIPTVKSRMRYAIKTLRGELAEFRDHTFDDDEHLEMVP